MRKELILSVDLGGTKTAAALVSSDAHIIHCKQELTSQAGPRAGIAQIARLLGEIVHEKDLSFADIQGIGIGIPAVLEAHTDRVIWAPNLAGWRDVDLHTALEAELGRPVCLEYDGHAAVLGEWWAGAGRGYQDLVSVIIGTGIGGGMVLDGRLIRGFNRLAGAAGWFALTTQARASDERSQAVGGWESVAAGPGIALRATSQLEKHPQSKLGEVAKQRSIDARDVFESASQGDHYARQVLNELGDLLGLGIANIVSLINPQILILGGSIGANCQKLLPRIRSVVKLWAQPVSGASVKIVTSKLGTNAGLLGAAYGALLRIELSEKNLL